MKHQIVGPVLAKLVHQFPGVIALAYDLLLTHKIACQKDLFEQYNFGKRNIGPSANFSPSFTTKCRLGPQNGSGSSRPEKLLKIVNGATITETKKLKWIVVGVQMGQVGGHQYPPGSFLPPQEAMAPIALSSSIC